MLSDKRLADCTMGLKEVMTVRLQKDKHKLELFFEKMAEVLIEIYLEQICLLKLESVGVLAEFLVYQISDFFALAGTTINVLLREDKENILMEAILNWVRYGRSRHPFEVITRQGEKVHAHKFLQASALKFEDKEAKAVRININLPNQPKQRGLFWGARLGNHLEKEQVLKTVQLDNQDSIRPMSLRVQPGKKVIVEPEQINPITANLQTILAEYKDKPASKVRP